MKVSMKKKWISMLLIVAMAVTLLAGCSGSATEKASGTKLDYSSIKIGEITSLVVNDGGWCQATHESLLAAMTELGIPEENLKVIENVAEDQTSVSNAYNALASEGVNLIIGASAGYATFLSELAAQNPDIIVAQQGDQVSNLIGYQIRNYEGMFLAGYASALMSKNNTLGFAASMSEASVRAAINGYALGAKYANPKAKVQVVWANSWYDVDIETQSAKTLINQGIKYMGMEASSPAIPQTCEANGAYCIGYNVDMQALAPKAVLFSYVWNFAPIFKDIMASVVDGTASSDTYYYEGGDCAKITAFNDAIVPKDVQDKVLQAKADIESGKITVFGGELKDNEGNGLVPAGQTLSDDKINTQEFLVENVIGTWK
ncbi:BMP family ABC transporter substrate-binding protein [Dehalobacter sp. DCM]|uniref:BMP family lipoprotein n=1 Tax=Dehalobacter sp. DCM TaxID=2907827 RepID=UPI00308162DF|nr:BMP family ABC transporter substrate-binding protein [Dehalobacter sp. DCM]